MVKKSDTDETTLRNSASEAGEPEQPPAGASPAPPARLRELFVLEERLGDGGMGSVFKALDLQRSKYSDPHPHVALKIIKPEVLRDFPDAALALQREASRAMELSHPNIVRIYGFYDFDPADRACFITMELLEGKPLDSLLRKHPRGLPAKHAMFLLEQICAGLQYAHDQRLVHSDLKPGNIFITDDGVVRILDFGIATPLRNLQDVRVDTLYNPRQYGALTPAYASLEQWDRLSADPRDDLYSLGCIAYEMLCGTHPFGKADARKACNDNMPVRTVRKLSARQNRALRKALSFRRDSRTASVEEFWAEFGEAGPSRVPRVAAIAAIAAAVVIGTAWWLTPRQVEPSLAAAPAPAATTPAATATELQPENTAAAVPAATTNASTEVPAADFASRCRVAPTRQSLQRLLDRGLETQADAALGQQGNGPDATVTSLRTIADCIVELRRMQISSAESEQWLKDVEALLQR